MVKTLDIDLYRDGFDASIIDCIDGPIAGASGYYNYDFYFFYSFYFSMLKNWSKLDTDFINTRSYILSKLGLTLKKHQINSSDDLIEQIRTLIDKKQPIVMIVKYNTLFYNPLYKNEDVKLSHAFIINGYNSENSIITIKDTTTLARNIVTEGNKDLFFTLHLTEEMIKDIWINSNKNFKENNSEHYAAIYSIEKIGESSIKDYNQLIADFLSHKCNTLENKFAKFIKSNNYNEYTFEIMKMIFSGSLNIIFKCLEISMPTEQSNDIKEYTYFKLEYIEFRNKILSKIYANRLRGKTVSQNELEEISNKIVEYDIKFFDLIERMYTLITKINIKNINSNYTFLSLDQYFNNEAFALSVSESTTANITGEGTHFIYEDYDKDGKVEVGKNKFFVPIKKIDGQLDNISCNNQIITVPKGYYNTIMFLGCSEYGSYSESFDLIEDDNSCECIKVSFSDFYQAPIFKEKTIWIGKAAHRDNNKVKLHNFNSRIFSVEVIVDRVFSAIKLPDRHNIHIFAISLT